MTSQRLEPSFLLTKEGPSVIFGCGNVTIDLRVGAEPRDPWGSNVLGTEFVCQVDVGGELLGFSDSVLPCPLDIVSYILVATSLLG